MGKSKKKSRLKRERRYFSEDFRRSRVKEFEAGRASVVEISRTYGVSRSAVYKWIQTYSVGYQKGVVQVVEEKSETKKRLALEGKVRELERLIGQQQVQISYYGKLLEIAQEHYQIDFEKNFDWKPWNGSSPTDPNTA